MASNGVALSTDVSLKRLFSSFVRKPTKQPLERLSSYVETGKSQSNELSGDKRLSDAGYWGGELSTDSFMELSSEVAPIDVEISEPKRGNCAEDGHMTENGNLWKDEVRRKCAELSTRLEEALRNGTPKESGILLKFSPELPERIAQRIANAASSEPCGLRGCCVHLRLLHEDIASALMASEGDCHDVMVGRAERCASWPDSPTKPDFNHPVQSQRPALDFTKLPDLDATLTGSLCSNLSTDSGYCDLSSSQRGRRRLQHSLSSSSVPVLPNLSTASRLHVACADIGRLDTCDSNSVPTFEIFVYLAPATSWTWRVRKLFFSSFKLGKSGGSDKPASPKPGGTLSVDSDFTIVKKKLYRTHSNRLEVIRCPPSNT